MTYSFQEEMQTSKHPAPIIKVCGMRDANNIQAIDHLHPDWMGFIFYPQSSRYVSEVPNILPQHAKRVGVFVHPQFRDVIEHVKQYNLDAVQFHGTASPQMCETFRERGLIVLRAQPVTETFVAETAEYVGKIDYFVFDNPTLKFGGSGQRYDWSLLNRYTGPTPFLLSGGLSPQLIDELKQFHHPFLAGYDINSGFEISPALKDEAAVMQFIKEIKQQ